MSPVECSWSMRENMSLFDMGCRPLDPMVHPNFCSDREILCLKRHFVLVLFLLYFPVNFQIVHIISLLFSDSKVNSLFYFSNMFCFLLNKWGLFYVHPQELLKRFPNIFHMAFCLKLLGLDS